MQVLLAQSFAQVPHANKTVAGGNSKLALCMHVRCRQACMQVLLEQTSA